MTPDLTALCAELERLMGEATPGGLAGREIDVEPPCEGDNPALDALPSAQQWAHYHADCRLAEKAVNALPALIAATREVSRLREDCARHRELARLRAIEAAARNLYCNRFRAMDGHPDALGVALTAAPDEEWAALGAALDAPGGAK